MTVMLSREDGEASQNAKLAELRSFASLRMTNAVTEAAKTAKDLNLRSSRSFRLPSLRSGWRQDDAARQLFNGTCVAQTGSKCPSSGDSGSSLSLSPQRLHLQPFT